MSICTVINERNRIFIEMPLGMPGPSSTKTGSEHSRIKYPAQFGSDCWFRGVEMIFFNYYGKLTEQEQTARDHFNQFRKIVRADFEKFTNIRAAISQLKGPVETQLKKVEVYIEQGNILSPEEAATVSIWKEYAEKKKQNNPQYSANDFAWEKFIDYNAPQRFLDILKISADDEYAQYAKTRPILQKHKCDRLSFLNTRERYGKMDRIALNAIYKEVGLAQSSWNPSSSFQQFREQLAQEGPLLLCGSFCEAFYRDDSSFQLKDPFYGRQVWAWGPNAPVRQDSNAAHAIIVVGAWEKQEKANTRELVYYKNVSDETDPQHPEQERLYVMRYDRLKKNVSNLWSETDVVIQGDYSVVSYAVYNPRIELKKI